MLLILPLIIISKAIYFCWRTDTWTHIYFIQQFTSSIPSSDAQQPKNPERGGVKLLLLGNLKSLEVAPRIKEL
nr:orf72 [Podospora anserina]